MLIDTIEPDLDLSALIGENCDCIAIFYRYCFS
jgi:hypothetical protein